MVKRRTAPERSDDKSGRRICNVIDSKERSERRIDNMVKRREEGKKKAKVVSDDVLYDKCSSERMNIYAEDVMQGGNEFQHAVEDNDWPTAKRIAKSLGKTERKYGVLKEKRDVRIQGLMHKYGRKRVKDVCML